MTGLAVQNLGNTATSYSGMLFYDQNGALGQFQGFNNSTHEYRINNVAKNGASQFNGSINFMVGSTSRFLVGANGNIGIGTTTPSANLEVSNALLPALNNAATLTATYSNTTAGSVFVGRKARGTATAPTQVLSGDNLVLLNGRGFGTTLFGGGATILMRAAENFTDTAMGGMIQFQTTQNGTNVLTPRMTITHDGNVGIGTTNPGNSFEIVRDQQDANIVVTSFSGATGQSGIPGLFFQAARGTVATPTAVQANDVLGVVGGNGYGTTGFGDVNTAIGMLAAENWTDTAHGTAMGFTTTPLGSVDMQINMAILPTGNVSIGVFPLGALPTAADKLQVFGDIRVGTTGTNGCIKNFTGTGIVGTCSSDRRLKKDITPFGPVLNQLTALQPVHYFWRASDFPDRHFGNSQNYGLIAQDVEQVLPELVATDSDGYKAVDYSKLPLLTIQAVKELKAENDTLKERVAELEQLKQRVTELERLLTEMLAASRRR